MSSFVLNNSPYKGSGQLTREQFLFYEMRTTAKLLSTGKTGQEAIDQIVQENLFQYPTEKSVNKLAQTCVNRLYSLNSEKLVHSVAEADFVTAKQICLYSMMRQYRLIRDFMISIIGAKFRSQDFTYNRRELNAFFLQLQEQDDLVASWSEGTVKKIQAVISRILIENEYIDDGKAKRLNPVLISRVLEDSIRENGDTIVLPAFNCLN